MDINEVRARLPHRLGELLNDPLVTPFAHIRHALDQRGPRGHTSTTIPSRAHS